MVSLFSWRGCQHQGAFGGVTGSWGVTRMAGHIAYGIVLMVCSLARAELLFFPLLVQYLYVYYTY